MTRTIFAILCAIVAIAGCSSTSDGSAANTRKGSWWACPPQQSNPQGAKHGQPCQTGADCMYGQCLAGSFLAGYDPARRFCSKNSNCAAMPGGNGVTVPCAYDNDGTNVFETSMEKTTGGGNDRRTNPEPHKLCSRICKSDKECAAWNPDLPHCMKSSTRYVSLGTHGACGYDPLR